MECVSVLMAKSVLRPARRSDVSSKSTTPAEPRPRSIDESLAELRVSDFKERFEMTPYAGADSSDSSASTPPGSVDTSTCPLTDLRRRPLIRSDSDGGSNSFDAELRVKTMDSGSHPLIFRPSDSGISSSDTSYKSEQPVTPEYYDRLRLRQASAAMKTRDESSDSACGSSPVSINDYVLQRSKRIESPHSYRSLKGLISKILYHASKVHALLGMNNAKRKLDAFVLDRRSFKLFTDFLVELEACCPMFVSLEDLRAAKDATNVYSSRIFDYYSDLTVSAVGGEERIEDFETIALSAQDRLQRTIESVLCGFTKVLVDFIESASSHDNVLETALGQLAHCGLFGDFVCFEIIQTGGISQLVRLAKDASLPDDTLKLTLRALAVLCSVAKGCIQLLALGGLDLIVRLLCSSPRCCAIEAAGVLTQLTAPCHTFAALPPSLPKIVSRLLDLCDDCADADGFLLCSAALANLSLQYTLVSDILYRQNSVLRIARLYHTKTCQSIFVQDQIATIFSQLCAQNYVRAVIAQGGIRCLLSLLEVADERYPELSLRIRYKAAICLGKVSSDGFGLKALKENNAALLLFNFLRQRIDFQPNPISMICESLLKKMDFPCELESTV